MIVDISMLTIYIAIIERDYFISSSVGLTINAPVVLIIIQGVAKLLKNFYKLTVIKYLSQQLNKKDRA